MNNLDPYDAYVALKNEMAQSMGYSGKLDIPDAFVRKIAGLIDASPTHMMTSYYVRSLLGQFYRKRTKKRSVNLFDTLNAYLRNKSLLVELFLRFQDGGKNTARVEDYDVATIWLAINDHVDGYAKSNYIGMYASLFTEEIASSAYQTILAMPDPYKTRALAGIFCRMDQPQKAEIFSYICLQFLSGSDEAAYRLKLMFPYLDRESRNKVISLHLDTPRLPERLIAYLVLRNAQYLEPEDADRIAMRVRNFHSDYFRRRCLLKLAAHLRVGEVEELFERFMEEFTTTESSSPLIHNLYHFGAVLQTLEKSRVISMALEKIACLDDSGNESYDQQKYHEMLFIMPLLTQANRARAFGIAETVKGGHKKTLTARLRRHFSQSKAFCEVRLAAICY